MKSIHSSVVKDLRRSMYSCTSTLDICTGLRVCISQRTLTSSPGIYPMVTMHQTPLPESNLGLEVTYCVLIGTLFKPKLAKWA